MNNNNYIFSSESVSEGHPDKIADQISDAIVDAFLMLDPNARVALETAVTTNRIILMGETRGPKSLDKEALAAIARGVVHDIGYEDPDFHWNKAIVDVHVHEQSADIAKGVDGSGQGALDEGAGDQGIMFGYACSETPSLMPAPIYYAHRLMENLATARHKGEVEGLGPDAKCQLSLVYEDGRPVRAASIVLSTQHHATLTQEDVRRVVMPYIEAALPTGWMPSQADIFINPTGQFIIGGPVGDAGLTGRKIIVDTYGGPVPHGGGAFSGKDPSKVDRSAAYALRYLAKNIVQAGLAEKCLLQVAYAIGKAEPLALYITTYGTATVPEAQILAALPKVMDLRPRGIRTHLQLDKPIYRPTAAYGHFGRTPDTLGAVGTFTWERTDLAQKIKEAL